MLEPGSADRHYWRDLWHYRELFAILAWRDVAVRYKQTAIGVAWALVRPLLTMVVFTIVFGKLAGLPSDGGVPYPVLVFAGMLPWFLFSSILTDASNSPTNIYPPDRESVFVPRLQLHGDALVSRIGVMCSRDRSMHGLGTPEDSTPTLARTVQPWQEEKSP